MKKRLSNIIISIICCCLLYQAVFAADVLNISHAIIKEDSLIVYIQNPGEYSNTTCLIGQEKSERVNVKKVSENKKIVIDTYILIDNSLSIQEKYRDTMKQVAKDIVFSKKDNERITIATFDTEIKYLTEKSTDSTALIQAIDQITFQNQDTVVIDVLYNLYNRIEADNGDFARIVFMSDGVENKTIGYTREELMDKVKASAFPVYMLGCTYNSNESELENMFRISRETNGTYYHLEKIDSADEIAAGIADSFNYVQVKALIPENQRDGSSKGIKIIFDEGKDEKSASLNMVMPFFVPEKNETEENETTATETENVAVTEPESATQTETETKISDDEFITENGNEQDGSFVSNLNMNIIVPSVIGGIVVLILLVVFISSKNKKKSEKSAPAKTNNNEEHTEILSDRTELIDDDDATGMADIITIRLIDKKRPSQIQEYSLDNPIVVGRVAGKSQAVFDYEKSISGKHCEIYRVGNKVYIRDLNSSNGTYVDGVLVTDSIELSDGSIIKIGRLQIEFQLI